MYPWWQNQRNLHASSSREGHSEDIEISNWSQYIVSEKNKQVRNQFKLNTSCNLHNFIHGIIRLIHNETNYTKTLSSIKIP